MKAYIFANIDIKEPNIYKEYAAGVLQCVEKFDGRYLVRAGKNQVLEGEEIFSRYVIIEFPSYDKALKWYNSKDYSSLMKIRKSASNGNVFILEGL